MLSHNENKSILLYESEISIIDENSQTELQQVFKQVLKEKEKFPNLRMHVSVKQQPSNTTFDYFNVKKISVGVNPIFQDVRHSIHLIGSSFQEAGRITVVQDDSIHFSLSIKKNEKEQDYLQLYFMIMPLYDPVRIFELSE